MQLGDKALAQHAQDSGSAPNTTKKTPHPAQPNNSNKTSNGSGQCRKLFREDSDLVYYCCSSELDALGDSQGHLLPVLAYNQAVNGHANFLMTSGWDQVFLLYTVQKGLYPFSPDTSEFL